MKLKEAALDLLFPPFCVHCDTLLPFTAQRPLCPSCLEIFRFEERSVCRDCFRPVGECECVPLRANDRGCIKRAFHIAEYNVSEESVTRSLILTAKDHDYTYMYSFMAEVLEGALRPRLRTLKNTVITYIPRDKRKVRVTGVDQARLTAVMLSRRLGVECVAALERVGGREQKGLDSEERRENADNAYKASRKAILSVSSKTVIIYDDVMTTGATAAAAALILKSMGARTVIFLSFGRAYRTMPHAAE